MNGFHVMEQDLSSSKKWLVIPKYLYHYCINLLARPGHCCRLGENDDYLSPLVLCRLPSSIMNASQWGWGFSWALDFMRYGLMRLFEVQRFSSNAPYDSKIDKRAWKKNTLLFACLSSFLMPRFSILLWMLSFIVIRTSFLWVSI